MGKLKKLYHPAFKEFIMRLIRLTLVTTHIHEKGLLHLFGACNI